MENLLKKAPELIPPEATKVISPIANSLKMATRMIADFPKSDLKGIPWMFETLSTLAPYAVDALSPEQLDKIAMKMIELGLSLTEAAEDEKEKLYTDAAD